MTKARSHHCPPAPKASPTLTEALNAGASSAAAMTATVKALASVAGAGATVANESVSDILLRLPQVLAIVRASRSSVYSWMAKGLFPKPIRIGPRATAWRWSDILAWIESRQRA